MSSKPLSIQSELQRMRSIILRYSILSGVLLVGLVVFIPVDEKVVAPGRIHPLEETYLRAATDGQLSRIAVEEGAVVRAGEVLAELDATKVHSDLQLVEARLTKARADLELRRKRLETVLKLPMPREFWHLDEDLDVAQKKKEQTAIDLKRITSLGSVGAVSQHYIESAQIAAAVADAELQRVQRKVEIVRQGLEETILSEARAEVKAGEEAVRILEVENATLKGELERHLIRAPQDGRVTLITRRMLGERVERGEDLFHVAHGEEWAVRLQASEREYHRIRPGQRVLVTTPAFDRFRHGYIEGEVIRTALESEQRDPNDPARTYRVKARIAHSPQPLVTGSAVEAKIILRRVPIWRLLLPAPLESDFGDSGEALVSGASPSSPPSDGSAPSTAFGQRHR